MSPLKLILLYLIFLGCICSCSQNESVDDTQNEEQINPPEYFEALNISYGDDANQKFDIYFPANRTTTTKVMILIHGGGWSAGDKTDMVAVKDLIRQDLPNLAIVNMNYRLADENNNPYPMQINDITSVINHLIDNQSEYIISEDFGFIGISAGAHLSLLWSYAFDTSNNIKMACSIVGPTNFTDPAYLNNGNTALQELLNLYGVNATTNFLEEVSPYHQVSASAPPTILFYGGLDPLIPTTQGTDLRNKLQNLDVTHEFTLYPNEGHGWVGLNLLDTWLKLKTFTQTHLN